MRISDVNVGNGVFRLNVEPTSWSENVNRIPTHVMDEIARNVATRLRNEQNKNTWVTPTWSAPTCTCQRTPSWAEGTPTWDARPTVPQRPMGEPDGFDAHIDRPKRENYGGIGADWGFRNDLRKYNKALEAVKECNWPCKEPMKNAPATMPFGQGGLPSNVVPQRPCACGCHGARPTVDVRKDAVRDFINMLFDDMLF